MEKLDRTLSIRLTEDEYQALVADAARHREKPATRGRHLLLAGLYPAAPAAPSLRENARIEALVRRATWAVIVALSADPRFDEAGTEAFLQQVLPR